MTDNVLQTLQRAIQDVIAPDVRELKVRVASIEKQMETHYSSLRDQMDTNYSSLREQQEANFRALLSAIGESKAKTDLDTYRLIAALTERVAALEGARH